MILSELVKQIDGFVSKYGGTQSEKMKADLLDLIQRAVEHGEGKNQTNIAGIAVKAFKGIFGGKD